MEFGNERNYTPEEAHALVKEMLANKEIEANKLKEDAQDIKVSIAEAIPRTDAAVMAAFKQFKEEAEAVHGITREDHEAQQLAPYRENFMASMRPKNATMMNNDMTGIEFFRNERAKYEAM